MLNILTNLFFNIVNNTIFGCSYNLKLFSPIEIKSLWLYKQDYFLENLTFNNTWARRDLIGIT